MLRSAWELRQDLTVTKKDAMEQMSRSSHVGILPPTGDLPKTRTIILTAPKKLSPFRNPQLCLVDIVCGARQAPELGSKIQTLSPKP